MSARAPGPRRSVEVETTAELERRVAAGARSMRGWRLQGLDLRGREDTLARLDPAGSLLLGCHLDPWVEDHRRARGAVVLPELPDVPLDPYRPSLYTPEELYAGPAGDTDGAYADTLDARVYAWVRATGGTDGGDVGALVAQALHDASIDDALGELVHGRRLVGVMGGHATERGSADYRDAAHLGARLARAGLMVATGGGPGAMEAANLGGYLAGHDEEVLDEALDLLSAVPGFGDSVDAWARSAFEVRERWPAAGVTPSLGVPTWHYGHEPPNVFADHVAKYVRNAVREDQLLHVCTAGVVFLPGRAGTVQEVFQDACENYYADPTSPGSPAPMVLVGQDFWTRELPVWPLLQRLSEGREMARSVHLVDDPAAAVALLADPS